MAFVLGSHKASDLTFTVDFWQKKFDDNVRRDQLVQNTLESQGIRYIVVWKCTIKKMQKDKVTEAKATEEIIHRLTLI